MLGIRAIKKDYFYTAKWNSISDPNEYGYFKCKFVNDGNLTRNSEINNMGGFSGTTRIATKNAINFNIDDRVEMFNETYNIIDIDGNKKLDGERAFSKFKANGNIETVLTLRRIM